MRRMCSTSGGSRSRGAKPGAFARYAEKLAALIREERTDAERRAFLQPVAIDAMTAGEPSEDPEEAIIAWLDREEEAPAGRKRQRAGAAGPA